MSSDKKTPRKRFISELSEDELYADEPLVRDDAKIHDETPAHDDEKISDKESVHEEPRRKTFHSKHPPVEDDEEKISEPEVKQKISHAEASGIVLSVVMSGYSLFTEDKPLFFLATALLIFLLRPLIGGLFGNHNQAVQNALHAFSLALFVGALIFLFL
ncbi:MAG: hypothetical protein IKP64_13195 [Selenomonadaceae bacterium]|nr:hypothetical protein [Selenomonadaceae bacterium]MBR4384498.1 hypothetical protein [Selenomonadaceae bacterium]